MSKPDLKPVLVTVERGGVHVLDLVEQDGLLAMPADITYRYIGEVLQHSIQQDGMHVKRWFALTVVQSSLGPFAAKATAMDELLRWNHLRAAAVDETTAPLF